MGNLSSRPVELRASPMVPNRNQDPTDGGYQLFEQLGQPFPLRRRLSVLVENGGVIKLGDLIIWRQRLCCSFAINSTPTASSVARFAIDFI
jgi:hypothetical protein